MINLEVPKKAKTLINQARQAATEVFRPISRKYDRAEHSYPTELDMLAALLDGLNTSGEGGAGPLVFEQSAVELQPGESGAAMLARALRQIDVEAIPA